MAFFKDLGRGFSSHVDAVSFIFKHGLWLYFLYPLLIEVLLYLVGFGSFFAFQHLLSEQIVDWIGMTPDADSGFWMSMLSMLVSGVLSIGLSILFFFIFNAIYKYIVLIILSPVLALLSERVEEIVSGNTFPFVFGHFLKDVLRGILISLRNMFLELLIVLGCTIIGWIPLIGWLFSALASPFLYALASYFLGFSMMDYTCERRRLSISQGVALIRKHKGIAIGNGIVFNILLMVPFIGISIGPVLSSVAATLATLEVLSQPAQQQQGPPVQPQP